MYEEPATATASVTTTATLQLPPGWTAEQPDGPLFAASAPGARLSVTFRELIDPRTRIPHQLREAACDDESLPPVTTSYLDLPAGRAILAHTAANRGAAQLWLPLTESSGALVLSLVADQPAWSEDAATLVAEIGRRLSIEHATSVRLRGMHGGSTVRSTAGRPGVAAR